MAELSRFCVHLTRSDSLQFEGKCLARVAALNHDDKIRRQFAVYAHEQLYVAERVDYPETIDARYWGCRCHDTLDIYDFFGNEPLANYLYGQLGINVPGLRCLL